jgi:hypothetical protein
MKLNRARRGQRSPTYYAVYKKSTASGSAAERKYVVDITGELPVILMEVEPAGGNIMKTYIYGNSEVLAQHAGATSANRYFYLHDRLGSVRLVISNSLLRTLRLCQSPGLSTKTSARVCMSC